jgi:hippurate hydrolase
VSNVIADTAVLGGTIRDFDAQVFETIGRRLREVVTQTCAAFGATAVVDIRSDYPVLVNHGPQTAELAEVAAAVLGAARDYRPPPSTVPAHAAEEVVSDFDLPMAGAEDFSYFLMPELGGKPGCFFFLGGRQDVLSGLATMSGMAEPGAFAQSAARRERSNCICHGTSFDFNDNIIPVAAVLWVRLVERRLGVQLYAPDELGPAVIDEAVTEASSRLAVLQNP